MSAICNVNLLPGLLMKLMNLLPHSKLCKLSHHVTAPRTPLSRHSLPAIDTHCRHSLPTHCSMSTLTAYCRHSLPTHYSMSTLTVYSHTAHITHRPRTLLTAHCLLTTYTAPHPFTPITAPSHTLLIPPPPLTAHSLATRSCLRAS